VSVREAVGENSLGPWPPSCPSSSRALPAGQVRGDLPEQAGVVGIERVPGDAGHGVAVFEGIAVDDLIFETYQNAGVRVYDISNAYAPKEIGAWVPPAPRTMFDVRPNRPQIIQSADVYVEPNGVVYLTDYNAGFYVLQFGG